MCISWKKGDAHSEEVIACMKVKALNIIIANYWSGAFHLENSNIQGGCNHLWRFFSSIKRSLQFVFWNERTHVLMSSKIQVCGLCFLSEFVVFVNIYCKFLNQYTSVSIFNWYSHLQHGINDTVNWKEKQELFFGLQDLHSPPDHRFPFSHMLVDVQIYTCILYFCEPESAVFHVDVFDIWLHLPSTDCNVLKANNFLILAGILETLAELQSF